MWKKQYNFSKEETMMRKMFQLMLVLALVAATLLSAIPALAEGELSVQIEAEIKTTGIAPVPAETYTVRMKADGDYPMPEGKTGGTYDLKITGEGKAKFPAIVYDSMGIFTYTISQIAGSYEGATYDSAVYTAKVTVYRDTETGERQAAIALRKQGEEEKLSLCSFLNQYPEDITLDLGVVKHWYDNNNAAGDRPRRLTVYLYANGRPLQRIVLSAATGWSAMVYDLPVYDEDGNEINYVWRETAIEGYIQTGYIRRSDNVTSITNTRQDEPPTPLGLGNVFINVGDCFE